MIKLRRVVGDSMLPTLRHGQLVLFATRFRKTKTGSVVLVSHKGLEKVKRVSRISGGTLSIIGDNRASSTDSRHFGNLSLSKVQGVLVAKF